MILKGEDYTWSHCTKAGNGAPYNAGNLELRFPFDGYPAITEIELAFNDPNAYGEIPELDFENAFVEGKPIRTFSSSCFFAAILTPQTIV